MFIKKCFTSLILFFLSLLICGCGSGGDAGTTQVQAVRSPSATLLSMWLTPANPGIPKSATQQFKAMGTFSDDTAWDITSEVTWNSSATSIATVSQSGLATGIAVGTATITATSGSVSANTILTVAANRTWTTTPDYASFASCLSQAKTGDTILVSAGSSNWGDSSLSVSKAVSIIGAGSGNSSVCDGSTSTCISGTGILFNFSTSSTPQTFSFRLSGFYLSTTAASNYGHLIEITGAGSGWRIDHNYLHHTYGLNSTPKALLSVNANVAYWTLFGLIDSNKLKNVCIYLGGGNGSAEHGWKQAAQWGSADALFIENNHFDGSDSTAGSIGVAVDNQNGGRATIRYNTIDDMYLMIHSACQTSVRGGRSYEIYNNLFRNTLPASISSPYYAHFRAGSALITRNHIAGQWTWGSGNQGYVAVDNRRSWFDSACTSNGFGYCNGSSIYDSNLSNTAKGGAVDGYRCLDQIGAGIQTGKLGSGQTQALDPMYVWSNTSGGVCLSGTDRYKSCTSDSSCVNSDCSTLTLTPNNIYRTNDNNNQPYHIVSGRDYYDAASGNNTKSGYSAYTCPHPLAGSGSCDNSIAGMSGYSQ